ncbi:MAG: hypothetical protein NTW95_12150 [Candidatus Aminicenantes bacterium]|nr:hypothetical protein [Candidatus Aminicenantes bacterium]
MKIRLFISAWILLLFITTARPLTASSRQDIRELGDKLAQQAAYLSQSSFEHFKGWKGEISDSEQAILFKSEAFAASCRLFLRLSEENEGFFGNDNLRTNLFNAFTFLVRSFRELEKDFQSSALNDCRETLNELERAFSRWPAQDNLAYLHQKFVQAHDQTVYLIERVGIGEYVRRPIASLESLYRFNFLLNRSKDPWKYRVEIERSTLEKMAAGAPIALTFNNCLVMDMNEYPNRPVFLIENGIKRPLSSPAALPRFGGWKAVFEVPASVIESYPLGEPIT